MQYILKFGAFFLERTCYVRSGVERGKYKPFLLSFALQCPPLPFSSPFGGGAPGGLCGCGGGGVS